MICPNCKQETNEPARPEFAETINTLWNGGRFIADHVEPLTPRKSISRNPDRSNYLRQVPVVYIREAGAK